MVAPPQVGGALDRLGPRTLAATIVLWATLSLMAEGENTRGLAVALGWTVFLSAALGWGPKAIENASHSLPLLAGPGK